MLKNLTYRDVFKRKLMKFGVSLDIPLFLEPMNHAADIHTGTKYKTYAYLFWFCHPVLPFVQVGAWFPLVENSLEKLCRLFRTIETILNMRNYRSICAKHKVLSVVYTYNMRSLSRSSISFSSQVSFVFCVCVCVFL